MARPQREDGRNPRTAASYKYNTANYRRITVDMDKAYYNDTLAPAVEASGQSMRAYILDAIAARVAADRRE